jgi:thiol-disulfide isomerase/thioredoxin
MRKPLLALALVGLVTVTGGADSPKPAQDTKEKPAAALKVGDPAPALKASKWLQGEEVKEFEPGKVYVVDFWATWCGWCIATMPDTAELQAQYKDRGVTVIGYFAIGDKAEATEYARKAVAAAAGESADLKQYIEQEAKTLVDE